MHVELGSKVGVKDAVDVFQMSASSVFVQFVGFGIWSMEMAAPRCRPKEVEVLTRDKHASLAHQ